MILSATILYQIAPASLRRDFEHREPCRLAASHRATM